MFLRNLTLSDTRSEHTLRVPTIYQFVTVFNHSNHAITFFPENATDERERHYRVPPRIYLTLPLFGAGTVESCQREVIYTVVSEGPNIPATVITLSFTETNNNVNMPFPDQSVPAPFPTSMNVANFPPTHSPTLSWSERLISTAGGQLLFSRTRLDRTQVLTGIEVAIRGAAVPTAVDVFVDVRVGAHRWSGVIGAGAVRGTRTGATGLYLPVINGTIAIECLEIFTGGVYVMSANGFEVM